MKIPVLAVDGIATFEAPLRAAESQIIALHDENDRLRGALRQISRNCTSLMVPSSVVAEIAMTALEEVK